MTDLPDSLHASQSGRRHEVTSSYAGIGPLSQWPTTRRELARLVLTVLLGGTALLLAWREMDTSGY